MLSVSQIFAKFEGCLMTVISLNTLVLMRYYDQELKAM